MSYQTPLRSPLVLAHQKGAEEAVAYFDAYLSTADYCAQRKPITGTWVFKDFYSAAGSSKNVKDTYFSSGIYTTPTAGAYHCCIEIRCKQGGYCDATLQK